MNNFTPITPEDMIRFLYNEMSEEETALMKQALESDWTLREKYEVLKSAKDHLNRIHFSPRSEAIEAILMHVDEVTGKVIHQ
jgi:hypothetical protein